MNSKKLVLNVVADVKKAKDGLGEVSQGIKDLFKLQQGSGRDIATGALKAFDGLHGALEGVMPVANAVLDVAQKGIEMAQFAGQRQLLLRQVGEDNLDALRASTRGLVDDQTLLQNASRGLRGDFALTTQQMQDVAAAAVTLHNEGFGPIPDIIQEITEKLSTGEVDGLKKYGINLTSASTQAQKLGMAHEEMARLAGSSNNTMTDSGTQVSRMLVTLKNIWDELKTELGMVVDVVATLVNGFVDLADGIGDFIGKSAAWVVSLGDLSAANDEVYTSVRGVKNETTEAAERQEAINKSVYEGSAFLARLGKEYEAVSKNVRGLLGIETDFEARVRRFNSLAELNRLAVEGDEMRAAAAADKWSKAWDFRNKFLEEQQKYLDGLNVLQDHENKIEFGAPMERFADQVSVDAERVRSDFAEMDDLMKRSALDNFDPVTGAVKRIRVETMNAKKAFGDIKAAGVDAFGSLTNAAGTSLQAIVSGNKAAQAGLSEVFKQLLDQLGTEMQINALKYLAMGTAAIWLDPPAAAGYFAAAGIFEAAALAAGVAERATGAPSGQAASAGGGGSSSSANDNTAGRDAGSSGGGGNVTVIHQYNINGFIGDEARLAREMENMRRRAELSGQVRMQRAGARRG